jgi:hypothetical protein
MTLEEILEQSKADLKMDITNLAIESTRNPTLHHKYVKEWAFSKRKVKAMERQKAKVERELFLYYTGKADVAVLKRKGPIDFKILKSDVSTFIESDPEMEEVQILLDEAEVKLETLESILSAISRRNWDVRNAVEYLKFTQGAG